MTHAVTDRDLSLLVSMFEEAHLAPPTLGMPRVIMQLAAQLVQCDGVTFIELDPAAARPLLLQDDEDDPRVGGDCQDDAAQLFWEHFWDTQPCSYSVVSGDTRTVTTIGFPHPAAVAEHIDVRRRHDGSRPQRGRVLDRAQRDQ
jgi:hypothetical protein